jgi:hypothetical protein
MSLDGRLLVPSFSRVVTDDRPLFRMKEDSPGPTMMVYFTCSESGSRR